MRRIITRPAATRLQDFPTEILEAIFHNLCIHCHHSTATHIPDFDNAHGRENKRALARLCLMNQRICSVAQPILFHYFNIDNAALTENPKAHIRQFLSALHSRPDLGHAVRALELLPTPDWTDAYPIDDATRGALQLKDGRDEGVVMNPQTPPLSRLVPHMIKMTPNIEQLLLVAPSLDKFDGWDAVPALPRMKTLEVVSPCDQHFRLIDLPNVLKALPNLTFFRGSSHMRLSCSHHFSGRHVHAYEDNLCDHKPWEILPSTLTKAVLGHVDIFRLGSLFNECPKLEDLEMFLIPGTYDWENHMPSEGALVLVRPTLKRLVVTMHDWLGWVRFPGMFEKRTGAAGMAYRTNMAFRKMEVLEDLAVDQLLLHADVLHATEGHGTDRLSLAMPSSLKSLHVGYVVSWPHLQPQLRDLAMRKSEGAFADLTTVRIDPFLHVSKAELEVERQVLAEAGIELVVGVNRRVGSGQSQQMLTPSHGSRYTDQ